MNMVDEKPDIRNTVVAPTCMDVQATPERLIEDSSVRRMCRQFSFANTRLKPSVHMH